MPTATVIIPIFNRANLIGQTINSVLSQSYNNFELFIIDDGSTDNTKQIIDEIKDGRIKYFYKNNGGVSSARNMGLKNAQGQFICFLDSDDLWPANFLQIMIKHLQNNPKYDAAYCMRTRFFDDGSIESSYQKEFFCSGQVAARLFEKTFIQTSAICFRKNALEGLFFDESLTNGEDVDFWLRVSTRTEFLFVLDVQIKYRQQETPEIFNASSCNRARVLERFYFKLGGDKYVSRRTAMRKLGNAWRSAAKKAIKAGCRKAAIELIRKALEYRSVQIRLYFDLLKAYNINKEKDKMPDWKMPKPLETNTNFIIEESK